MPIVSIKYNPSNFSIEYNQSNVSIEYNRSNVSIEYNQSNVSREQDNQTMFLLNIQLNKCFYRIQSMIC